MIFWENYLQQQPKEAPISWGPRKETLPLQPWRDAYPSQYPRCMTISESCTYICAKLGIPLIGMARVCGEIPQLYKKVPDIADETGFNANFVDYLRVTEVIAPADLEQRNHFLYEGLGLTDISIDLSSIRGMYQGIETLGERYGVQDAAQQLVADYTRTIGSFDFPSKVQSGCKVLLITGNAVGYGVEDSSYVASLLDLIGAENVGHDSDNNLPKPIEDALHTDPDFIFLSNDAGSKQVWTLFRREFSKKAEWFELRAVRDGHVFCLDERIFCQRCNFHWPEALAGLMKILFGNAEENLRWEAAQIENNT